MLLHKCIALFSTIMAASQNTSLTGQPSDTSVVQIVKPTGFVFQQNGWPPNLNQLGMVEHEDAITVLNNASQAMRDHHHSLVPQVTMQGIEDHTVLPDVHTTGSFVEKDDTTVLQYCSTETEKLFLAQRKPLISRSGCFLTLLFEIE
mmetsp:Transcript_7195/g.17532  ORF Transcript_7195/g.17532 Transcript_7195/m.17532 type:complete len:147 (-) Transcript_7195:2905-3345(-)